MTSHVSQSCTTVKCYNITTADRCVCCVFIFQVDFVHIVPQLRTYRTHTCCLYSIFPRSPRCRLLSFAKNMATDLRQSDADFPASLGWGSESGQKHNGTGSESTTCMYTGQVAELNLEKNPTVSLVSLLICTHPYYYQSVADRSHASG